MVQATALLANIGEKKDKLFSQLARLDSEEDETEDFRFIAEIVQALMRMPGKIRPCRRAVLSSVWDPDQRAAASHKFGATVTYVQRIPKEWLRDFLPSVVGKSVADMKNYEKAQKGTIHRLMCRACCVELYSHLPSSAHSEVMQLCTERAAKVGVVPSKKAGDGTTPVDWDAVGFYSLLRPLPPRHRPQEACLRQGDLAEWEIRGGLADILQDYGRLEGVRQLRHAERFHHAARRREEKLVAT